MITNELLQKAKQYVFENFPGDEPNTVSLCMSISCDDSPRSLYCTGLIPVVFFDFAHIDIGGYLFTSDDCKPVNLGAVNSLYVVMHSDGDVNTALARPGAPEHSCIVHADGTLIPTASMLVDEICSLMENVHVSTWTELSGMFE